MKKIFVDEIVRFLAQYGEVSIKGEASGMYIDNIADVKHVNTTTLDWINTWKDNKQEIAENSPAKVILADNTIEYNQVLKESGKVLIVVANPKIALAKVGVEFFVEKVNPGIHPTAIIDPEAKIGDNVYIGPYSVIGKATIGDNCVINAHCRIYDCVTMGHHCFLKDGVKIGGPGFGFEIDEEGHRFRFPQIGVVIIGNYVEIGANTCIDRGSLSNTIIGDHVKIDNLCQIAHNDVIGDDVFFTAQAGLAGSVEIGKDCWIAPNAVVNNGLKVGDNCVIGISTTVMKNVKDNKVCFGSPAKVIGEREDYDNFR